MELLHVVEPSSVKSKKFDSVYIDLNEKVIIEKKELSHSPLICGRNMVYPSSDDPYGFSQAMSVLPSIKALNSLRFNVIKISDLAARDIYLAGEDVINPANVLAGGGVIQGGMDENGRPTVQQLQYQGNSYPLDKEIQNYQQTIRDVLFVSLYLTYQQTQSRSATDAMIKANEKTNLLAPIADRLAREVISPMIELEMFLLDEMNLLPKAPEELVKSGLDTNFEFVFDNPILKSQKFDSAQGIFQLVNFVGQAAATDQGASFDTINFEEAIRQLQDILNAPVSILRTPEEIAAIRAQRAQAQNTQNLLAAMPQIAGATKDLADAQKTASTIGVK